MRLAAACGINAAQVEYHEFEGAEGIEPAIVIERYDRLAGGDVVRRLHQEDLCQALGCLPENKYTDSGGPGCADVLELLKSTGDAAQNNIAGFLQMLFFNYLIAATDAHAKNYSIMLEANGEHRLAPMYDVASIAPYVKPNTWKTKPPKLAMSIGGENRAGCITANNLSKLVRQSRLDDVGITPEGCAELMSLYADIIPAKLAEVFDHLKGTASAPSAKELRSHMEEPIAQLCKKAKARL